MDSSQSLHDEFPFKVTGILKNGNSHDRLVIVSLEALTSIKIGKLALSCHSKESKTYLQNEKLDPKEITAFIVKSNSYKDFLKYKEK